MTVNCTYCCAAHPARRWMQRIFFTSALLVAVALVACGGSVERMLIEQARSTELSQEVRAAAGVQLVEDMVLAVLETDGRPTLVADVQQLGGKVDAEAHGLVRAWLPVDRLEQAAAMPGVSYVRRPHIPVALDVPRQASEGRMLIGANLFHSRGVLGGDVSVAVIDVGFGSLAQAGRMGEICPWAIRSVRDYAGGGIELGGPHGTGVAQIVHNMAPGADLYLARISDEVGLALAVADCIADGVDIIVHSVGWVNTNFGDGTGVIAEIARVALDAGIVWVNAAGNHAQKHWMASFSGAGRGEWLQLAPDEGGLMLRVITPGNVQLALTWDEWPHAMTDLDLYLVDERGVIVGTSENRQEGREPPAEFLSVWLQPGRYEVFVRHRSGPGDVELEIYSLWHDLEPYMPEMSVLTPADVEDVWAVGAIGFGYWNTGPQQPYSSQGPTNDGRPKPDIMGLDGVTSFAFVTFHGTSAAAPHVAGAAALLLSQARRDGEELCLEELWERLSRWALDLGEPGRDYVYGEGQLRIFVDPVRAKRSVLLPSEGGGVAPGGTFSVELRARMSAAQQGGLELREQLPPGFRVIHAEAEGEAMMAIDEDGRGVRWHWSVVPPGREVRALYEVSVSPELEPGAWEIEGTLNGEPIVGDTRVHVGGPPADSASDAAPLPESLRPKVVAWPNPVGQPTVTFSYEGHDHDHVQIRLRVHDTSGRRVFTGQWYPGPTYQWHLHDDQGRVVPNGVYLFWMEVRMADGGVVVSELDRLLVSR